MKMVGARAAIIDRLRLRNTESSVAEPHHFYAAPGKNFDPAPAPTLLYSKAKFLKRTKVETNFVHMILYDL
jgi:hypothetical protein